MEAGVDDLEAVISQGSGDGLGATVMAVETRFGDDNPVVALHNQKTLGRRTAEPPTRHNGPVPATPRPPRLRSPLARAIVPVLGGLAFFALFFLGLWMAATVMTSRAEPEDVLSNRIFEVGKVDVLAESVAEDGPILFPDLKGTDGVRTIVLDHAGNDPAVGWQVWYGHPADREPTCRVEHVRGSAEFIDCEGRTLSASDLAPPGDVRPIVENRRTLYIDLRGLTPSD